MKLINKLTLSLMFFAISFAQDTDPSELLDNLTEQVLSYGPKLAVLGFFIAGGFYMLGSEDGKEKAKKVAIGCIIFATAGGLADLLMGT